MGKRRLLQVGTWTVSLPLGPTLRVTTCVTIVRVLSVSAEFPPEASPLGCLSYGGGWSVVGRGGVCGLVKHTRRLHGRHSMNNVAPRRIKKLRCSALICVTRVREGLGDVNVQGVCESIRRVGTSGSPMKLGKGPLQLKRLTVVCGPSSKSCRRGNHVCICLDPK